MERSPTPPAAPEFETRLFATDRPGSLLPFARSAIRTVGSGSVEVAEGKGLQVTLPSHSLQHLLGTLDDLAKNGFPTCQSTTVFEPPVRLDPERAESAAEVVRALGLCPPDMQVATVVAAGGVGGTLFVAGPPDRASAYAATVLPALRALLERPIQLRNAETNTAFTEIVLLLSHPLPAGVWELRFDGQTKATLSDGTGRSRIVVRFASSQAWMGTTHLLSYLRLFDTRTNTSIVE